MTTKRALAVLLDFVTSGRRYTRQNPYTIPEVKEAFAALGLDPYEPTSSESVRRIGRGLPARERVRKRTTKSVTRRRTRARTR